MGRIAVDVVLLPDEAMTNRAIELNRRLVTDINNGWCPPASPIYHSLLCSRCAEERQSGYEENFSVFKR